MPPGVAVFLAYGLLILAGIAVTLPGVVAQAEVLPISPIGVVAMGLLAYTIFTLTLTLQRKEAARALALGLSSLTIPAIPILLLGGVPLAAGFVALVAVGLFRGLTLPSARRWLSEP
jgi:succinate-acetate transporter protein